MAALDTLWFDLDLDDSKLQQKIKTLKSQLSNLGIKLNSAEIEGQLKNVLKNKNINVKVKADTSALESALRKVDELLNRGNLSKTDVSQLNALTRAISTLAREKERDASATDKETASAERNVSAQRSLANAHERVTQGVNSHINANVRLGQSLTGLISFTGDLRNQIGMLISVYTVEHLVKNVVQIGGEFEKQKLAMGSMLGSLEQADDIFNRMKNLALTSPFNFKDLSNYSRQLAAYGTDYKDLYDTTNRLADISAGLGGDMSRLVLAFSQVKAAAYLRGQEMRQFTEFGVALPDLLAQKYSKAEGRIVTAGDVIERVSKRMVSFNDVKDVLWQSTDKGGKFYGMQNVLAQSTSGMASNLKDAIDTMYYDIANSNSGVIKGTIKDITTLVGHWRELSAVLAAGTLVYGGHNIAMSVYNRLIGVGTAETLKGVMASKAEEASVLRRKALYGELTAEEKVIVATSKELTATDLKRLASSKAIDAEAVIRMVNTKKITAAQALQVASDLALTDGELKYLMTLRSIDMQLAISSNSWKMTYSKFTLSAYKNLLMFGKNVKSIASGIRTAMASMFTPANVAMAAIFMGLDAIMDYNQRIDKINETNKNTIKNAEDGFKNLSEFLSANPIQSTIKGGNESEISKMVDVYKEQLQSQPIDMSGFITNVDSISDATQKLIALRKEAEALKTANDEISKNGNPFAQSEKAGSTWVPDWLDNVGIKAVKILHSILPLSRGFRNMAVQWGENSKSMEGVLSDVSESMYDLQGEMSQLNKTDIDSGLQKLRALYPQLASEIDDMRRAGASNNEVILSMLQIARDKKITLFDNIDINKIDDLNNNTKVMMDRMDYYVEDGINRINSSMNRVDVERKSEAWKLAVMKSASEQAKAWNLVGDALDAWTFKNESAIAYNSARIQDHPKAYQDMYNGIKAILAKNGVDITKATKDQVNDAFRVYKEEMKRFKPYLSWWLSMLNVFSRKNPIYIWTEMRNISNEGGVVLTGRGADMWKNQAVRHAFKKEDLQDIKTNDDVVNDINSRYEQYKKDLFAAKANGQSTEKLEQGWINNVKAWESSGINVDYILSKGKTPKPKKTGGGSKEDTFLKDMQNRLEQVKKAMDVYKKWKETGISETEAIGKAGSSGILPKDTFNGMTSENDINAWYKKVLGNLIREMRAAKSTPERKKYTESIAELFGDFDQKAMKDKLDDMGKRIEKTISEVVKNWDFYKKVKDATGNESLAQQLAFGGVTQNKSVLDDIKGRYGNEELAKKSGISFGTFVGMSDSQIDAKGLSSLKKYRDEYISEDDKLKQETVSNLLDLVQKNKDYAQQILDVRIKLAKDLADIEANRSDLTKSGVDVDKLKLTATKKANNEISKINFTKFKEDTDWATIFGDLDKVSNRTLSNMVIKLKEMSMSANMGVDEIKAIQEALKKIEDENLNRNPFKGIENSVSEIKRWKLILDDINSNGVVDAAGNRSYTYKRDDTERGVTKGQKVTQSQAENGLQEAYNNESKTIDDVVKKLQSLNEAFSMVASVFEKFGNNGMSDATGLIGSGLSNAVGMGSSLKEAGGLLGLSGDVTKKLGIYGMAAGAAFGIIGGIAGLHDKKLDRAIEKSKQKVQELQNAYKAIEDGLKYHLGNAAVGTFINTDAVKAVKEADATIASIKSKGKLSIFDLMALSKANQTLKENWATAKYLDKNDKDNYGNAYNYQRNLYEQQLEQLKKQKQAEEDLKKPDQSKINNYKQQISDMESKIANFSEELMSQLYGIDFKGWASQLGDALFAAWQKGESGAEAFKKTANSIIANLIRKFVEVNVIQKAFDSLQKQLFGENGKGGLIGKDNKINDDALEAIDKFFSTTMPATVDAADTLYDKMSETAKKYGYNTKDTTSSSSTTNAISGVSEQEANIIAAYMDAIRQDTYNNRMNLQKIVDSGVKIEESPIMQAQLLQLTQIQSNTYKNMELVGDIKSMFNDVILGNKKIYVN